MVGPGAVPAGVLPVEGTWPGIKLSASENRDQASSGPTGVPWIDSNGWQIRLQSSLSPGREIWVNALPPKSRVFPASYLIALADAAAHGARWIVSLDPELASGILNGDSRSRESWARIHKALEFFSAVGGGAEFAPVAVMGILSDFSGKNEFLSHELLNLIALTQQQYRIMPKGAVSASSFQGLAAVIYPDETSPEPALRKAVLQFVEAGGLLITGPRWGALPEGRIEREAHPRFTVRSVGRGRMAVADPDFEDPYLVANDAVILMSHRHELLRFWNGGSMLSCLSVAPSSKKALLQMVFYAAARYSNQMTVRVAGSYRSARLRTLDRPDPVPLQAEIRGNAIELFMPPLSAYAAVELQG